MATPSITVSQPTTQPGSASHTVPTVVNSNSDRPLTPKINTTPFPSKPTESSCYLCDEQNPGDFTPTTKFLEICLLCARPFCPVHKAVQFEHNTHVCNVNHSKYYHDQLREARDELALKSPDGKTPGTRDEAEVMLNEKGIFPSLGEREKVLFRTSPVSPGKLACGG